LSLFHGPFTDSFVTCKPCRDHVRALQTRRDEKKKTAQASEGAAWCVQCKRTVALEHFDFHQKTGERLKMCNPCRTEHKQRSGHNYNKFRDKILKQRKESAQREYYNAYQRQFSKCSARGRLNNIKCGAKHRGVLWLLDDDDALDMIQSNCFYCGCSNVNGRLNGIDRLCSTKPYTVGNCVSCCWPCNDSKGSLDPNTFLNRMVMMHALQTGSAVENTCANIWGHTNSGTFRQYKINAHHRKLEFDITPDRFHELTSSPCCFCHRPSAVGTNGHHGIDRIVNEQGYVEGNVRACCRECNFMRGPMTLENFVALMTLVAQRAPVVLDTIPSGIDTCLRVQNIKKKNKR
jgi:hypothetical protein